MNKNLQTDTRKTKQAPTVRRTQEQRRERTRLDLIQATISCIDEYGLTSLRLNDIVSKANVTSGAVQHLFGSRDQLIIETIDEVFVRYTHNHSVLVREGDLLGRLNELKRQRLRQHNAAGYRAYFEIMIRCRTDKIFGEKLRDKITAQSNAFGVWFTWYLGDLNIEEERLLSAKYVLAASFYGVEVVDAYRNDRKLMEATLDTLIDMIALYLS